MGLQVMPGQFCAPPADVSAAAVIAQCDVLLNNNKVDKALNLIDNLLAQNPALPQKNIERVRLLIFKAKLLINVKSSSNGGGQRLSRCHLLLARTYEMTKCLRGILSEYQAAAEQDPANACIPLELGKIYEDRLINHEKALDNLSAVMKIAKKYPTPANKKCADQALVKQLEIFETIAEFARMIYKIQTK
jgi:tetratricopeptide (TPR) repeat protein